MFTFIVFFFINDKILFIQKYLHTHFGELSACKLPFAWPHSRCFTLSISVFMLEKCFFNVIFDVVYYNMTENQYFSVMFISTCKIK